MNETWVVNTDIYCYMETKFKCEDISLKIKDVKLWYVDGLFVSV
jgi:hypothetical protein